MSKRPKRKPHVVDGKIQLRSVRAKASELFATYGAERAADIIQGRIEMARSGSNAQVYWHDVGITLDKIVAEEEDAKRAAAADPERDAAIDAALERIQSQAASDRDLETFTAENAP